jgi:hypothetical protein
MQKYFNYRNRTFDDANTKFVGFEKVAMDFEGNDVASVDKGSHECFGVIISS